MGSREQERLTNLGNAVALAVRYSFDFFVQVRPELEKHSVDVSGLARLLTPKLFTKEINDILVVTTLPLTPIQGSVTRPLVRNRFSGGWRDKIIKRCLRLLSFQGWTGLGIGRTGPSSEGWKHPR